MSIDITRYLRKAFFIVYDVVAVVLAMYISIITRFEFSINKVDQPYIDKIHYYVLINICVSIFVFACFKLYSSLWQYASIQELVNVALACALSGLLQLAGMTILELNMPRSYYVLYFFYITVFVGFIRFLYRTLRVIKGNIIGETSDIAIPTMVIGGGDSASHLIKDIKGSMMIKNRVKCVIDADPKKVGNSILGVPIVGNDNKLSPTHRSHPVSWAFSLRGYA